MRVQFGELSLGHGVGQVRTGESRLWLGVEWSGSSMVTRLCNPLSMASYSKEDIHGYMRKLLQFGRKWLYLPVD